MPYVRCNLCGADDYDVLYESLRVVRCRLCGLVYVTPQPESETYGEEYFTRPREKGGRTFIENREGLERFFDGRLAAIERYRTPGRLLEVGCALGYLLNAARKRGWDATGVEISEFAAKYARARFGHRVLCGRLEDLPLDEASFDVVVLRDVVEHAPDPKALLKCCHRVLVPDGLLALSTPNFDSLYARIAREAWVHLKPGEHLFLFGPGTLSAMVGACGFRVVDLDSRYLSHSVRGAYEAAKSAGERARVAWNAVLDGDVVFLPVGSLPRKGLRAAAIVLSLAARPFLRKDRNEILELIARKHGR